MAKSNKDGNATAKVSADVLLGNITKAVESGDITGLETLFDIDLESGITVEYNSESFGKIIQLFASEEMRETLFDAARQNYKEKALASDLLMHVQQFFAERDIDPLRFKFDGDDVKFLSSRSNPGTNARLQEICCKIDGKDFSSRTQSEFIERICKKNADKMKKINGVADDWDTDVHKWNAKDIKYIFNSGDNPDYKIYHSNFSVSKPLRDLFFKEFGIEEVTQKYNVRKEIINCETHEIEVIPLESANI